MAKYKVGDKVRIVSKRPQRCWNPYMDKHLGKTMTIIKSGINAEGVYYCMEEDRDDFLGHWCWYEDMIAGLVEPAREPCTVELRFDGMITTATLKRGGRDVKTAEARCNPKDTYSRAEGARAAVARLFEKKRKEDKPKESKLRKESQWTFLIAWSRGGRLNSWQRMLTCGKRCSRSVPGAIRRIPTAERRAQGSPLSGCLRRSARMTSPKESKPKVGDKFIVTVKGGKFFHGFGIGDIVTLVNIQQDDGCFCLVDKSGFLQVLHPSEVRPYEENAK